MTIGAIGIGGSSGGLYQASGATPAPSSGPAASPADSGSSTAATSASGSDSSSQSQNSVEQITYRNPCGDTVTFSGIVVVDRTGTEVVGQPETSDCDPTSQKLAKAYSAY